MNVLTDRSKRPVSVLSEALRKKIFESCQYFRASCYYSDGRTGNGVDAEKNSGASRVQIVPIGVYLYKLRVNEFAQTRKMTFMK